MKIFLYKYWPFFVIIVLSFFVTWPLMRSGYFSHQDDLQIIRIFEMRKCFLDMQIPCRWVPDMGWGNGMPLFNFYGVFVYYLGGIISYITGFIWASKILFLFSLIAGSIGIYLLVESLWGKYAGVTSGILYLFAPYKALDIYVRGALAESFALTLIPFVFYFAYRAITSEKGKNHLVSFIISFAIFLITHNIMVLIFSPFLMLWIIYWLHVNKWKGWKLMLLSLMLSFGLSAFFTIPAFLEKNLVQTESLTRFELDFRANYLRLSQLFIDRVWGYGTSIPGPEGGMNFQIGWPHWWLVLISLPLVFVSKIKKNMKILGLSLVTVFTFSIFMTHNRSTFIWEHISLLQFFQFPWRFLSLSIFASSILGGFVVSIIKNKWQVYLMSLLVLLTVMLNWNYFRPRSFYYINDSDKLSGQLWEEQRRGALLDYLPKTALEPRQGAENSPIIRSGSAVISGFQNYSNRWLFSLNAGTDTTIELPVFYFPNWKVYVDGKECPFSHDNILGRISLSLTPGTYNIEGRFKNTIVRTISNIISVVSLGGLVLYTLYAKNKKIIV